MPAPRIARLAAIASETFAADGAGAALRAAGFEPVVDGPDAFSALLASEFARWAPLIRRLALRATD